jgi:hypothetical protein
LPEGPDFSGFASLAGKVADLPWSQPLAVGFVSTLNRGIELSSQYLRLPGFPAPLPGNFNI